MTGVDLSRAMWRKSTRSGGNGGCVEVADLRSVTWRKSARSGGNGACVEVADLERAVVVRDSKDPDGPRLIFHGQGWRTFADSVKRGAYDL